MMLKWFQCALVPPASTGYNPKAPFQAMRSGPRSVRLAKFLASNLLCLLYQAVSNRN